MLIPTAAMDIVSGLREDTDEERDQLALSLKMLGLLQPIVAFSNPEVPGRYVCLAGRRRLLAARRLGWDHVECTVREGDEVDRELVEIAENLHRKELLPLERSRLYRRMVDLYSATHPEVAEALRARRRRNLKVGDLMADAEAAGGPVVAEGSPPSAVAAVAAQMGVAERTVRRAVAADRAADVFTRDQRAVMDHSGLSSRRIAAVAAVGDGDRRAEVVTLIAANMSYPAAMREVLGDEFEGDDEEDADLTDEEFLASCPIRGRVNRARFDADALLYRRVQHARRQFARAIGWGTLKSEVGQGGVYFARLARLLEAPHPRDWLQCHDCAKGKTQHGDCRKCGRGGGYQIG